MSFNLESSKNREVNETPENKPDNEKLTKTGETADNFDDCGSDMGKESGDTAPETEKEVPDDFDDCGAKPEEVREKTSEEPECQDDFEDCGKKDSYVVEVTYTTDGELSEEEVESRLQDAYNDCSNPEDMDELKENANTNEHIEVIDAQVVEGGEKVSDGGEKPDTEQLAEGEQAVDNAKEQENAAAENEEQLKETSTTVQEMEDSETELPVNNESITENTEESTEDTETENNTEEIPETEDDQETGSEAEDKVENIQDVEAATAKEETAESDDDNEAEEVPGAEGTDETAGTSDTEETGDAQETGEQPENAAENVEDDAEGQDRSETADETEIKETDSEDECIGEAEEEKALDERVEAILAKEDADRLEMKELSEENADALQEMRREQSAIEKDAARQFNDIQQIERGTEEYRQALQEYNRLKAEKEVVDGNVADLERQQAQLEDKQLKLRELQLSKGEEAVALSAMSVAAAEVLDERYNEEYFRPKQDEKELSHIMEENSATIDRLSDEKAALRLAMDAKMDQIADYVYSNNMGRYETSIDPYYKEMSEEYLNLKAAYERTDYSMVKLDVNNSFISEALGKEYVSLWERRPLTDVKEVAEGRDVPGKTNYFVDELRASEVLGKFEQENWDNLSLSEQKRAVRELADYNAEILGVKIKPEIVYYYKEPEDGMVENGYYDERSNLIHLNKYRLTEGTAFAETLCHEYRHKYQHERSEMLENQRDLAFKENFDDYVSPEDNYFDYLDQPVEADARNYAAVMRKKMENPAELEAEKAPADPENVKTEALSAENTGELKSVDKLDIAEHKGEDSEQSERKFLTNDGELISYELAINRITSAASDYMDSLSVDEATKAAAIADMREELIAQQREAESRNLGDHGIRHIYGNFERGESYLKSRNGVSDEERLAVVIAQVYHDEGYRLSPSNLGTLNEGNCDARHDEESLLIWHEAERRELYGKILSAESLASIDVAIGEHNSKDPEKIKANTSLESDVVVSTVHVCDKLALSQREKFSELLVSDPKLVELTEGMNSALAALKNEELGFYENGKLSTYGEELLRRYHSAIEDYIDSKGYDAEYAARLKEAVSKDVGFNAGKYSSRMNYIYTPSDCFKFNAETGKNEICVYEIVHPDAASTDIAKSQAEKLLEDLGVPKTEIPQALSEGEYDFGEDRALTVRIKPIAESEIRAVEAARFQENKDLKEVNERIEEGRVQYRELTDKLAETAQLMDGEDISYDDFRNYALAMHNKKYRCSKKEFESYSSAEKEKMIKNIISDSIIEKADRILHKKG